MIPYTLRMYILSNTIEIYGFEYGYGGICVRLHLTLVYRVSHCMITRFCLFAMDWGVTSQ